jgi:hypothetical protein
MSVKLKLKKTLQNGGWRKPPQKGQIMEALLYYFLLPLLGLLTVVLVVLYIKMFKEDFGDL